MTFLRLTTSVADLRDAETSSHSVCNSFLDYHHLTSSLSLSSQTPVVTPRHHGLIYRDVEPQIHATRRGAQRPIHTRLIHLFPPPGCSWRCDHRNALETH